MCGIPVSTFYGLQSFIQSVTVLKKEDVHKRLKDVFQDNPVDVWDCEII